MALADIKQKIISEAEGRAAEIISAAKKLATEKLTAAQKIILRERLSEEERLVKEREQALLPHRQVLALESNSSVLSRKRTYLQQVLDLAVERITQKSLPEFYAKILKGLDLAGAQIFIGGDIAPVETACQKLGINPKITLKEDWPAGRLELDYGLSRMDCSLPLYAQELSQTLEAELAEKLWL